MMTANAVRSEKQGGLECIYRVGVGVNSPNRSERQIYTISKGRCLESTQSRKRSNGTSGIAAAVRQKPPEVDDSFRNRG